MAFSFAACRRPTRALGRADYARFGASLSFGRGVMTVRDRKDVFDVFRRAIAPHAAPSIGSPWGADRIEAACQ
jgi:hypothetical protein